MNCQVAVSNPPKTPEIENSGLLGAQCKEVGWIYLIHFSEPLGSNRHKAQHYAGFTQFLYKRFDLHCLGIAGAAITRETHRRGIKLTLANYWLGTRDDERRFKKNGHYDKKCPICGEALPF